MKNLLKKTAAFLALICMALAVAAACGAEAAAPGRPVDEDFGYKGVQLGTGEEEMLSIMGEADYDREDSIFGIPVKHYEYGDISVSVATASKRVVDIDLRGRDFRVRDGIRYGSTTYWICHVYGKVDARLLDGDKCYIYARPGHKHQHLLLRTDSEKGGLLGLRITSLPLSEEEAEEMIIDGTDIEEGLAAEEPALRDLTLDTSALPLPREPKLVLEGAR